MAKKTTDKKSTKTKATSKKKVEDKTLKTTKKGNVALGNPTPTHKLEIKDTEEKVGIGSPPVSTSLDINTETGKIGPIVSEKDKIKIEGVVENSKEEEKTTTEEILPEEEDNEEIKEVPKGTYKYGKGSERRMTGADTYLMLTAYMALDDSTLLDWGVGPYGGVRTAEQQYSLYLKGASRADGTRKLSYHQFGKALDLVPYKNGKYTWEFPEDFLYIKQRMFKAWNRLKKDNKIPENLFLHWGGFWRAEDKNSDGKLQANELGWDLAHFEVRTYKQKVHFRKELKAA